MRFASWSATPRLADCKVTSAGRPLQMRERSSRRSSRLSTACVLFIGLATRPSSLRGLDAARGQPSHHQQRCKANLKHTGRRYMRRKPSMRTWRQRRSNCTVHVIRNLSNFLKRYFLIKRTLSNILKGVRTPPVGPMVFPTVPTEPALKSQLMFLFLIWEL